MNQEITPGQGGMEMSETSGALSQRILILAPTGNDARLTAGFLEHANLSAHVCGDVPGLCAEIERGCGAILLAEETLANVAITRLIRLLEKQPPWSDVPVTIITSGGEASQTQLRRLALMRPVGNVTLLERPFRPDTLVSTLEVALRTRRRQYEIRGLLDNLAQARDEALASSRAKDDFLATLSHELRTPLNPVLLVASDAATNPEIPEKIRGDFEMIRKNIELEARLIDDLLDLTRVTRGKLTLEKTPLDIHAVLRDAIANIENDIREKQIRLKLNFTATRREITGDAVRLQQVFWNVLKNAAKFTPRSGKILVQTCDKDSRLVIEVTDSGIGIKADDLPGVFDAFSQGSHAREPGPHRFGGLGLGLAISKKLVEFHAGNMTASSPGPGLGATFRIELPVERMPEIIPPVENISEENTDFQPARKGLRKIHILLVEDHEPTRTALHHLLLRRNYTVEIAGTISEARALLSALDFDLLISDIGLPDGNGCDLMKDAREKGLPGIALTGYGMENDVSTSYAAGFTTHLIKPVRVQLLEKALGAIFQTSAALK